MSGRLAGQVAWVSGAASGIGAAAARLFAAEGAAVGLADIDELSLQQLTHEITAAGGRAISAPCDVADSDQVRQSIAATESAFDGLQIVVNSAGIVHVGLLHTCSEASWDRVMNVNVRGIYLSIRHSIEFLSRSERSYVVNIGSISGFVGQRATPAYTTSKGAVLSLTRSIALDYASIGLRCNCVCPGITDTPMLRTHLNRLADPDAALDNRLKRVPLGRALQPADIARTVLYLSCEDSAGVTGTSVTVDGGYLAAAEWNTDDDGPLWSSAR
jgi:NAD(P)-dependent dehydrogenase (short-subunit alcohol dehydrogenase family)